VRALGDWVCNLRVGNALTSAGAYDLKTSIAAPGFVRQPSVRPADGAVRVAPSVRRHSGVCCLIQHSPQIFIAFRGATATVLLRAFLLAGTGSHPRGQLRCRWERTGLSAHLRDYLLRRIHSQTRYFRQSDHGILMGLHGLRDQAVEFGHLLIDQLQSL